MSQFCLRRVMATNACRQAQMTWRKTMNGAPKRPKNREVENEMVCPPEKAGQPPRPVNEPAKPAKRRPSRGKDRSEEHTPALQALKRNTYAVSLLKKKTMHRTNKTT